MVVACLSRFYPGTGSTGIRNQVRNQDNRDGNTIILHPVT